MFFRLLFLPLLFGSQALQTFASAGRGEVSMFSQITGLALAVALILVTVHYLRQARAARRFALEHMVTP